MSKKDKDTEKLENVSEETTEKTTNQNAEISAETKSEEALKETEAVENKEKEATENVASSSAVKLKILVAFTDKNNGTSYALNDVVEFSGERAEELLKDERKLVEEV